MTVRQVLSTVLQRPREVRRAAANALKPAVYTHYPWPPGAPALGYGTEASPWEPAHGTEHTVGPPGTAGGLGAADARVSFHLTPSPDPLLWARWGATVLGLTERSGSPITQSARLCSGRGVALEGGLRP